MAFKFHESLRICILKSRIGLKHTHYYLIKFLCLATLLSLCWLVRLCCPKYRILYATCPTQWYPQAWCSSCWVSNASGPHSTISWWSTFSTICYSNSWSCAWANWSCSSSPSARKSRFWCWARQCWCTYWKSSPTPARHSARHWEHWIFQFFFPGESK